MKRFLIIQIRPEDKAADNELESFMKFGDLGMNDIHRIQIDRESLPELDLANYAGVIIGGGPNNVSDKNKTENSLRMEKEIYALLDQVVSEDVPYLGACYGFGALVVHQGGQMSKERYSEQVGAMTVDLAPEGKSDYITKDLPDKFRVYGGHKEACQSLPASAVMLAGSDACPVQMIRIKNNIYATQFHPELDTDGIIVRIYVYKNSGYFPPENAEKLIESVRHEKVTAPLHILKNFVGRYRE